MDKFIKCHLILGVINFNHSEESCKLLVYQLKVLVFNERALWLRVALALATVLPGIFLPLSHRSLFPKPH